MVLVTKNKKRKPVTLVLVAVTIFLSFSFYNKALALDWTTPMSPGDVTITGRSDIELDSDGNPHVLYTNSGTLYYIYHNGSNWSAPESVASSVVSFVLKLDSNNKPHAVFSRTASLYRSLHHRDRISGSWGTEHEIKDGDVAYTFDFEMSSSGTLYVPYIERISGESYKWLKNATSSNSGVSWNYSTVDSVNSNVPVSSDIGNYLFSCVEDWIFNEPDETRIFFSSSTRDVDADPYTYVTECKVSCGSYCGAAYSVAGGVLKYTQFTVNGTLNSVGSTLLSSGLGEYDTSGDTSGNFYIPFVDTSASSYLKIRYRTNDAWFVTETVDSSRSTNYPATIANSSNGQIHLSYFDTSTQKLMYTRSDGFVTPPTTPPVLSTSSVTTTSIQWNYTDPNDDEDGTRLYDSTPTLLDTNAVAGAGSFEESGLSVNTQYTRLVRAYNDAGESGDSNNLSKYTLANAPGTPTVNTPTVSSLKVVVDTNSNPSSTEFALYESSTAKYAQADGSLDTSAVWQTYTNWGGVAGLTVTGLSPNTQYTWQAKARNGDSVETSLSAVASVYTLANAPGTPTASGSTTSSFKIVVLPNSNPATTQYAIFMSRDSSGYFVQYQSVGSGLYNQTDTESWQTYTSWGGASGVVVTGLWADDNYSVKVKARNTDLFETNYSATINYTTQANPAEEESEEEEADEEDTAEEPTTEQTQIPVVVVEEPVSETVPVLKLNTDKGSVDKKEQPKIEPIETPLDIPILIKDEIIMLELEEDLFVFSPILTTIDSEFAGEVYAETNNQLTANEPDGQANASGGSSDSEPEEITIDIDKTEKTTQILQMSLKMVEPVPSYIEPILFEEDSDEEIIEVDLIGDMNNTLNSLSGGLISVFY